MGDSVVAAVVAAVGVRRGFWGQIILTLYV